MRRALLAFLLLIVLFHAPWRLMALAAEVMMTPIGNAQMSAENDKYWECIDLEGRLIALGWQVQYVKNLYVQDSPHDEPQKAFGVTYFEPHLIQIEERLSWNARLAVLAHEGGHVLQRGWLTHNQGEAFAEAVAALVAHDGLSNHARLMARFRTDAVMVLMVEWRSIYRAASVLEDK